MTTTMRAIFVFVFLFLFVATVGTASAQTGNDCDAACVTAKLNAAAAVRDPLYREAVESRNHWIKTRSERDYATHRNAMRRFTSAQRLVDGLQAELRETRGAEQRLELEQKRLVRTMLASAMGAIADTIGEKPSAETATSEQMIIGRRQTRASSRAVRSVKPMITAAAKSRKTSRTGGAICVTDIHADNCDNGAKVTESTEDSDNAGLDTASANAAVAEISAVATITHSDGSTSERAISTRERHATNLGICVIRAREIWEKSLVWTKNIAKGAPGGHLRTEVRQSLVAGQVYYCDVETGVINAGYAYVLDRAFDPRTLWECKVSHSMSCGERRQWKGFPFFSADAKSREILHDQEIPARSKSVARQDN